MLRGAPPPSSLPGVLPILRGTASPSILLRVPPILRGASSPLTPFGHPRYSGGGRPRSQYSSVALVPQPLHGRSQPWPATSPAVIVHCLRLSHGPSSVVDVPPSVRPRRRSSFSSVAPGKAHTSGALRCHSVRRYSRLVGHLTASSSSIFRRQFRTRQPG